MPDTMRSVLTQGARRFLDNVITFEEFEQGLILAIAESPKGKEKDEDLRWLAVKLTSTN